MRPGTHAFGPGLSDRDGRPSVRLSIGYHLKPSRRELLAFQQFRIHDKNNAQRCQRSAELNRGHREVLDDDRVHQVLCVWQFPSFGYLFCRDKAVNAILTQRGPSLVYPVGIPVQNINDVPPRSAERGRKSCIPRPKLNDQPALHIRQ